MRWHVLTILQRCYGRTDTASHEIAFNKGESCQALEMHPQSHSELCHNKVVTS